MGLQTLDLDAGSFLHDPAHAVMRVAVLRTLSVEERRFPSGWQNQF
jgi:hypothetical protein